VSALGVEEQRVNVLIDLVPALAVPAGPAASEVSIGGAARADVAPAALLGDGWRVVVRILTRQEADVLRVPVSAVFPWPGPAQPADTMGVFVVEGGRARLRTVQVVARNGSLAWVRSGLTPGEVVIAYPPPAVADGVRVKPRQG
jgi:HlyD family secretion protein